ncbi:hypothetical protein J6590_041703 [Homalodisca vitripennis]|nr:hypothetical protein J6590_041703 [Homalodisca vitripennis]
MALVALLSGVYILTAFVIGQTVIHVLSPVRMLSGSSSAFWYGPIWSIVLSSGHLIRYTYRMNLKEFIVTYFVWLGTSRGFHDTRDIVTSLPEQLLQQITLEIVPSSGINVWNVNAITADLDFILVMVELRLNAICYIVYGMLY